MALTALRRLASRKIWKRTLYVGGLLACLGQASLALPGGAEVKAGQANVQSSGNQMTITQQGERAIIDWNNFSIGAGEAVQFLQPSSLSAVLNRVVGADPSVILGALRANGQVYLVNPNGVFFGPGSQVDVGSLVVSTLHLSDQDFMAGNHRFTQLPDKDLAAIVNQGTLKVQNNGMLILVAPHISNQGLLVASQGKVALAAGEQAAINFDGSGLINFQVADLANDKSTVLMPTQTADQVLRGVVSHPGIAQGTELAVVDGQLQLVQGSGTIVNSGTALVEGGELVLNSTRATVLTESSNMKANRALILSQGQAAALPGSQVDLGQDGFAELSGQTILMGLDVQGTGHFLIDPPVLTIADGPMPAVPAADTVYEEDLESRAVFITLAADDRITVEDIGDDAIELSNNIGIFLTTSNPGQTSLEFEDPADAIVTQGTGDISVDVAGDIEGGNFVSDTVVALLSQDIGQDELVGVAAPLLSLSADGDVELLTDVDEITGSVTGSLELREFDDVTLSSLSVGDDVFLTAAFDILGKPGSSPDLTSGGEAVLISTLGVIGTPAEPLDVDIGEDLLVSAGDDVAGFSVTLEGAVDGEPGVSFATPGLAELNGFPIPISDDLDFNDEVFFDLVDLGLEFGLDDPEIEELYEELGLLANQSGFDGPGQYGGDWGFDGPGEHHGEGPDGEFGDGPDGDWGEGPDGEFGDGPEGDWGEGPEGSEVGEGPDEGAGEEKPKKGEDKKGRSKQNGTGAPRIPYVAQAGLNRQLNTRALMGMNINQFQNVVVQVGQPSPFDLALQQSYIRADDIVDLQPGELNNFNLSLSYDINQDPILTNPSMTAGDLLELAAGDLGEVPVSLDY